MNEQQQEEAREMIETKREFDERESGHEETRVGEAFMKADEREDRMEEKADKVIAGDLGRKAIALTLKNLDKQIENIGKARKSVIDLQATLPDLALDEIRSVDITIVDYMNHPIIGIYAKSKDSRLLRLAMAKIDRNGKAIKSIRYDGESLDVSATDRNGIPVQLWGQVPATCKIVENKEWVAPSSSGYYRTVKKIICTEDE